MLSFSRSARSLDRTNVVQSVFGRRVLDQMAAALGAGAAASAESFEARFKHVWADNADAMSLRYTGVGALKTDFTRSGKRSGKGIAQDAIKSVKVRERESVCVCHTWRANV